MRETPTAVRLRVGSIVKHFRLRRGLSQERLAELVGDAVNHLGMVERGQVNVSIDMLTKIAASLSVPVADLFGPRPGTRRVYIFTEGEMEQLTRTARLIDRATRERRGK